MTTIQLQATAFLDYHTRSSCKIAIANPLKANSFGLAIHKISLVSQNRKMGKMKENQIQKLFVSVHKGHVFYSLFMDHLDPL